ncbi:MAG: O-antigen ligase family protein [Thermoleophilia bacterium]
MSQMITEVSQPATQRTVVYGLLATLALIGLLLGAYGRLRLIPFIGFEFSLVFLGVFLSNLRMFILVYFTLRTLLEYFTEPTRVAIGNSSIQLVGTMGAVILVGGIMYIIINDVKIREMSVVGPMLMFLGLTLPFLLLLSPDKMIGLKDWIGIASGFFMFVLVIATFRTRRDLLLLLRVIVLSAIVPLAYGFYQLATGTGNLETAGFNRIDATFVHPNPYGFYLAVMLLLCIPLLLESKQTRERAFYGALVTLMTVSIIFTYARAAWLSLLAGLVVLAAVRYRKLFILMPVVLGLLLFFVPSIFDRFQELMGFSQGQGSMYSRVTIWRYLLPYFYQSPVVGAGLGGFSDYMQEGLGYVYMPHNDYLRVLIDTGVVGIVSYLAIWLGLARGAIRAYLRLHDEIFRVVGLAVLAIVGAYLVMTITDNMFRFALIQSYIWCLAGIVAAAARIEYPDGPPAGAHPDDGC